MMPNEKQLTKNDASKARHRYAETPEKMHDLMTMRLHQSAPGTAAGRRQSPSVCAGLGNFLNRPGRPLTRPRAQQGHPGRNVQVQVIEQSKSSAETYIESLQQSLKDEGPQEDSSVVVSDISELKQRVHALETQVRIKGCMGASGGLHSLS